LLAAPSTETLERDVIGSKFSGVFELSTDSEYRAVRSEFAVKRARLLLWCIAVIYPAFGLLDWLVYPEWVRAFFGYRALVAMVAIGLVIVCKSISCPRYPKLVLGFAWAATVGVILMCALTEGFASRYLVGVILCMLGIATVEVAQPRALAGLLCSLSVLYALFNTTAPFDRSQIISSLAFLSGAVFFCILCAGLMEQQRRQLFAANVELVRRNVELERAKQQQGKFLSTVSHELRSPINSVLGFAELILEREAALQPKTRDNLSRIQQSSRHLLRLVNDLLDLAKTEAGRMELEISSFDLVPLVNEVADQARVLLGDRPVAVRVQAPAACTVRSDPTRLRQILLNLATNAAKFTLEGEIRISAEPCRDDLLLEVRDTGIGIADEHQELIFEAFKQVHRGLGVGGTGLGLSIVSHMVDLLQGSIEVESEVSRGSSFRVRLERVVERSAA
jgi:signal transduction histidine kinase